MQQGEDAGIAEGQGTGPLAVLHRGPDHRMETIFAERAVVAESLNVEQTSVGVKAERWPRFFGQDFTGLKWVSAVYAAFWSGSELKYTLSGVLPSSDE